MESRAREKKIFYACVLFTILGSSALFLLWPDTLLRIGYAHSLLTGGPGGFERVESSVARADVYRQFNESVNILTFTDGSRLFTHNGYTSTHFTTEGDGVLRETITGVAPYLYSHGTKRALQIGVGGGITAGALGHLYDHTTAVEINPAVIDILPQFREDNLYVTENPNVNIMVQDGMLTLYDTEVKYDLIVNSIPSPTYYSANKLLTKDVFSMISTRLAPGGVYSGTFGIRLGADGVKTLFKTFEESFADCKYMLLSVAYFNIVCSNEELVVQRMPEDEALPPSVRGQFSRHELPTSIAQFILDLEVPFSFKQFDGTGVAVNTLDRPVLEFITAPTYALSFQPEFLERFFDAVRGAPEQTSEQERARKCRSKRVMVSPKALAVFAPACVESDE